MTPQQALDLIDQNLAQLNGTREAHVTLQQAVAILQEAIKPKPKKE